MAKLPVSADEIIKVFGPHKHYPEKGAVRVNIQNPDEIVKTHCCFCGLQCGIKLKKKNNKVVGFEPWKEFPFNEGRLCPKGVQRYMQDNHPDRLLSPYKRVEGKGFVPIEWDEAYDAVIKEIRRIQDTYGKNAFAMLSGVSLSNEKSYMVGKFARVALKTANLDYNGRLCMVSAGAGNKKSFGMDRSSNSWADLAHAEVIIVTGANVSECFPVLTYKIWEARDNGAKVIVIDPREIPLARTADLHLPLRPGTDSALTNTMLKVMIDNDWLDHDFIDNHTSGFEEAAEAVKECTLEWGEKVTGVPADLIYKAAEMWGKAKTSFLMHARGIEHHSKGVMNVCSCINLVLATGRIGKPYCGYGTITGQGNGQGGREHGHKCDQLPGNRDIENPEHRKFVADVWGIKEEDLPGKGLSAYEIIEAINRGEIKGLLSICFNPLVSLPNNNNVREALEKLEFYAGIDFFLSETLRHADIILAGSLQEEEEGTTTSAEGRVIRIHAVVDPPGKAKKDSEILMELARRLGEGDKFNYANSEETFNELRVASRGSAADYYGISYERIEKNLGVFWPCPSEDHPGTPRLWEDKKFNTPDKRAHFNPTPYRNPMEMPDEEYPVILTTGRVVSQYLSGSQTRRIGKLVDLYPEPLLELHPKMASQYGIQQNDLVKVSTRRGTGLFPANIVETIREDTVFLPYHWGGVNSANQLTNDALDPVSKIPEFKACACKLENTGRQKSKDSAELAILSRDIQY
ncbi:molybdopterin oxidoreductase family protein [Chryseobacterium sp. CT-SW4]|uniref:molybdopterin oxidoreductase family protein n=1 Tax=Chryseobacterium sp. SW-1 TaxID=3157343 RepID=UPI003B022929